MNEAARLYLAGMLLLVACGDRSGERAADDRSLGADSSAAAEDSLVEDTLMGTDSILASPAIETLSGRILVTGPEPGVAVTLQLNDSTSINLIGDLESELHNLSGATVSVEGRRGTEHPTLGTFDVYRYWVTSIDGVKPEVGIFESYETAWFLLVGDTPVALANVPDDLKTRDGALIWIIGERTPTRLRVQSYGVIKPK